MVKVVCEKEELIDAMDNARVELNWLVKVIERTFPENGNGLSTDIYQLQIKSSDTADLINRMLFCLKGSEK